MKRASNRSRLSPGSVGSWMLLGGAIAALTVASRHPAPRRPPHRPYGGARIARRLHRSAGTLAACVLLDSGLEHYRGAFHNKAMIAPLVSSSLSLLASLHGTRDARPEAHRTRTSIARLALLTGCIGTGFHVYNVRKRIGGVSAQNLFYGAPIGAPAALGLTGLMSMAAERFRRQRRRRIALRGRMGRGLARLATIGLLGTTGEAALFHFRGAFHNPFMMLPVSVPPLAAAALASTTRASADGRRRRRARTWLRFTALLGLAGVGFHSFGIARNMGGWRNWTQNVLNGPPLPAPPSFTALALLGLAALELQEETT